jgi:hypothetical protein
MNIPSGPAAPSPLQQDVDGFQSAAFNTSFMNGINNKTGSETDTLQYSASVTCRDSNNNIVQTPFAFSRNLTGGEHAVRVTEWVLVRQTCPIGSGGQTPHAMLVEVLLWRG